MAAIEGNPDDIDTNRLFVGNLHYRVAWQDLKSHFRAVGDVRYADVLRSSRDQRSKGCGIVEMETIEDAKRAVEELHGSELFGRPIFIRADRPANTRAAPPRDNGGMDYSSAPAPSGGGGGGFSSGGGGGGGGGGFSSGVGGRIGGGGGGGGGGFSPAPGGAVSGGMGGGSVGSGGDDVEFEPDLDNLTNRLFVGNLAYPVAWQDLKDLFGTIGTVAYADVLRMPDGRSKGCGIVEFVDTNDAREAIERLQNASLRGRNIFIREDREDYAYSGRKKRFR